MIIRFERTEQSIQKLEAFRVVPICGMLQQQAKNVIKLCEGDFLATTHFR